MKNYISLGSSCCPGLSLRKLGLKTETYPFDWVRTNNKIIYDILSNGAENFLSLDGEISEDFYINEMYNTFYGKTKPTNMKVNYYGQHFTHYKDLSTAQVVEKFTRYIDRFFKVLNSNQKVLFIQSHEDYIVHKKSRNARDEFYDYLCKISNILDRNYPNLNYHIINIEIDNYFDNSEHITNLNINYNSAVSDNCENFKNKNKQRLYVYRDSVTNAVKQFLNEKHKHIKRK